MVIVIVVCAFIAFLHLHSSSSSLCGNAIDFHGRNGEVETLGFEEGINQMVRTTLIQYDPSSGVMVRPGAPLQALPFAVGKVDPTAQLIVDKVVIAYEQNDETANNAKGNKKGKGHYLKRCSIVNGSGVVGGATSGVRIVEANDDAKWTLETLRPDGSAKTFGGDELYVTFTDDADARAGVGVSSPTAVARVVDLANGRYDLYFLESRSPFVGKVSKDCRGGNGNEQKCGQDFAHRGRLVVEVVHTCGASLMDPPAKEGTSDSGYIGVVFESPEVPAPPISRLKGAPHLAVMPYPQLADYDVLLKYGDSVMHGFFEINSPEAQLPNMMHTNKSQSPLNSLTLMSNEFDQKHPKWLDTIEKYVQRIRSGKTMVFVRNKPGRQDGEAPLEQNAAMVVGSCAWDLTAHHTRQSLGRDGDYNHLFSFYERDDHLESVRTLVTMLRTRYPLMDLYWMGCSAVHRQKANGTPVSWATWYPNNLRARTLDASQKALMKELNIPVIDMFETTYEIAELYADHVH